MSDRAAIRISNLSKRFGNVNALDDVSFDVPENTLYGLLGPNGAGKTTLFSVAANFLQATAGDIEVMGVNVRNISDLRGRFSMLPQDAQFQRNVPVIEQMVMFCRLHGDTKAEAEQKARRALATVGLEEAMNRAARTLSHGMNKRMALAQAFLGNPDVVLLDEPTAGLDPQNASQIRDLIREMKGRRTVVVSSHNLQEIQDMCDGCAILDKGSVVSAGAMDDLLGTDYVVDITFGKEPTSTLVRRLRGLPAVSEVLEPGDNQLEIHLDLRVPDEKDSAVESVLRAVQDEGFVPRTITEGARLEKRFLEVTGGTSDNLGSS